ncbi:uncharacterized protein LOC120182824 [Hibiscus syriacus]|uniref:uncharacterized protein LOC120182824 n=1 Tax=Hibiscus syriacus TaxID=106335 RepID=UPI001923CC2B|nr:uncharacterized protein LOC120182824 [Hibiscus syriacus]
MVTAMPSTAWHAIKIQPQPRLLQRRHPLLVQSFRRSDFDTFTRRMASDEAWKDAWRTANNGFEQFIFEAKKTAERLDHQYSISRQLSSAVQSATERAREIDREFEIGLHCRTFSMDFSRNWPRYRKQLNDFLDTPLGRSSACTRQSGGTECGYYVCKFMKEIVDNGLEVMVTKNVGDGKEEYTDDDVDDIRKEWVSYVANVIMS